MKTNTPFLIRAFFFSLLIAALQSCHKPATPGIYKNDKISADDQSVFNDLNTKLFAALKTNDEPQLEYMMSEEFIAITNRKRVVELASNRFKEGDYSIVDQYYLVRANANQKDTLKAGLPGTDNYSLYCPGGVKEMYIVCFAPKKNASQYLITAVYCKLSYGWKLNQLDVDQYAVNGKTAPELYQSAKANYAKGYLVNAVNDATAAVKCTRPSSIWSYDAEAQMIAFYNKMMGEAYSKYRVPLPIKGAPVHLEVIRILTEKTTEGEFPMIYYLTNIKLSDTTALKKENDVIQKVIDRTFPGISADKKYVFYSAFNEWPTGKRVEHFDIKQRVR